MRLGPTVLCLLAFGLCTAEARAGTRWRGDRIRLEVEPSLAGLERNASQVVALAAERWAAVPGAPEIEVREASRERGPGYDPSGPTNSITFAPDGSPLVGGALAITLLTYDADTLELLDADVIFNGRHRLLDVGGCEPDDGDPAYDFEGVVQHELGHVLGLEEDLEHPEAVMYPYASPWSTASRSIKPADEAALATLYSTPLPDEAAGCGARVAPSGHIAMWNCVLVLGLIGAAITRRRRWGWGLLPGVAVCALMASPRPAQASDGELIGPVSVGRLQVVAADARWEGGVLYTDLQLMTRRCDEARCGEMPNRLTLVGGSRDGVVQVLGREPVPGVGAFLEVVAPPPRERNRFKPSHYRTVIRTKGGESLWIQ